MKYVIYENVLPFLTALSPVHYPVSCWAEEHSQNWEEGQFHKAYLNAAKYLKIGQRYRGNRYFSLLLLWHVQLSCFSISISGLCGKILFGQTQQHQQSILFHRKYGRPLYKNLTVAPSTSLNMDDRRDNSGNWWIPKRQVEILGELELSKSLHESQAVSDARTPSENNSTWPLLCLSVVGVDRIRM